MAEFELPTAVGSENSSVEEFKSLDSHESFLNQDIYQFYKQEYDAYLERNHDNPLVKEIHENIWPKLTGETLFGPNKISFRSPTTYIIDPLFFDHTQQPSEHDYNSKHNSSFTFFHVGEDLTGHSGIVHGGLLATVLDEITCRLAFQNFPSKKGVTANLNLNYRKPCFSNNYILVRCDVIKKTGRKCWVKGAVYSVDPSKHKERADVEVGDNLLTECEILVIEPKWVNDLQNKKQN